MNGLLDTSAAIGIALNAADCLESQMAEIINIEEISKVAASAEYHPDHDYLLAGLRHRYPASSFNRVIPGEKHTLSRSGSLYVVVLT
jgi:hypothetical protein